MEARNLQGERYTSPSYKTSEGAFASRSMGAGLLTNSRPRGPPIDLNPVNQYHSKFNMSAYSLVTSLVFIVLLRLMVLMMADADALFNVSPSKPMSRGMRTLDQMRIIHTVQLSFSISFEGSRIRILDIPQEKDQRQRRGLGN